MTLLPVSHAVCSAEWWGEFDNIMIRHLEVSLMYVQSRDVPKFSMPDTFELRYFVVLEILVSQELSFFFI